MSGTLSELIGLVFVRASDPPAPPPPSAHLNDVRNASSSSSTSVPTDAAIDTLALLTRAQRLADSVGVISSNDSLRDISTSSLRTLFLPSLRAELEQSVRTGADRVARTSRLSSAQVQARTFLATTLALQIVPKSTRSLLSWQLAAQDMAGLEFLSADSSSNSAPPHTREIKIALFRLERALKTSLDEFRSAYRGKQKQPAGKAPSDPFYDLLLLQSSADKATQAQSTHDDDDDDDEEEDEDDNRRGDQNNAPGGIASVRQYLLALLNLHVIKAAALLQSTSQELELLRTMPPTPERLGGSASDETDPQWRLDRSLSTSASTGPLMGPQGKVLRPFTITSGDKSRTDVADQVFRPSYRLPTMTIDEYLQEEQRRGNIIQGGGQASYDAPTTTEQRAERSQMDGTADAYAADEEQRQHDLYWDDFTESNRRGAGNTMNRG